MCICTPNVRTPVCNALVCRFLSGEIELKSKCKKIGNIIYSMYREDLDNYHNPSLVSDKRAIEIKGLFSKLLGYSITRMGVVKLGKDSPSRSGFGDYMIATIDNVIVLKDNEYYIFPNDMPLKGGFAF